MTFSRTNCNNDPLQKVDFNSCHLFKWRTGLEKPFSQKLKEWKCFFFQITYSIIHIYVWIIDIFSVFQIIDAPCSKSPDLLGIKQASHGLWKSVQDGLDWLSIPRCWSVNSCNGLGSFSIVHFACVLYILLRMLIHVKLYELLAQIQHLMPCFCENRDSGYLHFSPILVRIDSPTAR